jgi:hypothetical protein
MKDNIYIRSLEIGHENIEKGISYFKIKEMLTSEGFEFNSNFEEYYINWFFENFYEHSQFPYYHGTRFSDNYRKLKDIGDFAKNQACILSAKAFMDYMDYIELSEARSSSNQANKNAINAIKLTITALIVTIILGIVELIIKQ